MYIQLCIQRIWTKFIIFLSKLCKTVQHCALFPIEIAVAILSVAAYLIMQVVRHIIDN